MLGPYNVPLISCIDAVNLIVRSRETADPLKDHRGYSDNFIIVVVAWNAEKQVGRTIRHLLKRFTKERILFYDDGSTDSTVRIAKSYGLDVIEGEHKGKVESLRSAVEEVKRLGIGYVVTLDADTVIDNSPHEIGKVVDYMENFGIAGMGGRLLPDPEVGRGILFDIQELEYKKAMEIFRRSMENVNPCVSGAFGIFRVDELLESLYNTKNNFEGEDFRRTCYLLSKGYKVGHCSSLHPYTEVPLSLKDLIKQRVGWEEGYLKVFFENIKFIKRKDRLGLTWKYALVVDFLLHPFKLCSLPFLILHPELGLLLYVSYVAIEMYSVKRTEGKVGKNHIPSVLLSPLYNLCMVIGPRTIGWMKALIPKT